jgi:hypothetical protein
VAAAAAAVTGAVAADMAAAVAAAAATGAAIADRAKTPIQYFCSKSARFTAGRFLLIPFREAAGMCR